MRSSRSSARLFAPAFAIAVGALLEASLAAHRLDEYLQTARVEIAPRRVGIELDLTPGVEIAPAVVAEIDTNGDGLVADEERRAYILAVLEHLTVEIDGRRLAPEIGSSTFPDMETALRGTTPIRLRLSAPLPALASGSHRLRYASAYRPRDSVYLANAMTPASDRISVRVQHRTVDQRELVIEFALRPEPAPALTYLLLTGLALLFAGAAAVRWQRGR